MTEEEKTLKYLSAMRIIDFNKFGFIYEKETITDVLNLIQRKDKQIDLMANTIAQAGVGRRAFTCDFGKECDQNGCRICIKKYFKKQAKEV